MVIKTASYTPFFVVACSSSLTNKSDVKAAEYLLKLNILASDSFVKINRTMQSHTEMHFVRFYVKVFLPTRSCEYNNKTISQPRVSEQISRKFTCYHV